MLGVMYSSDSNVQKTDSALPLADPGFDFLSINTYKNQRLPAGSLRHTKSQNINMKKFIYKAVAV